MKEGECPSFAIFSSVYKQSKNLALDRSTL